MSQITKRPSLLSNLAELQKTLNKMYDPTVASQEEDFSHLLSSDWVPTIDVKDQGNQFLIYADVPGVELKDIEVNVDRNLLTIRGQKESKSKEEQKNYVRYERLRGSFYRSIALPENVDATKIAAKFKNGVLEIIAPKLKGSTKKKVKIKK